MKSRLPIFFTAAAIIAIGFAGLGQLDKQAGLGFLLGALTLGGGLLICGIFSIQMKWHGMMGAGILALLGFGRGLFNLPGLLDYASGERPRGHAPLLELGVTLACAYLLLRVWKAWGQERIRRMIEED